MAHLPISRLGAFVERPLASLPHDEARAFISRLYGSDERFARGFHRYWREVIGLPEEEARENVERELALYGGLVLANLSDPRAHTIGYERDGTYQPIGLFAFRPLLEYAPGRDLHAHFSATGVIRRFDGRLGIGHATAVLKEHATRGALETLLLSIACKAIVEDFAYVFFWASDNRLATLYRHYGVESSPDLALPGSSHVVGVYRPGAPENVERMKRCAQRLGVDLASLPLTTPTAG